MRRKEVLMKPMFRSVLVVLVLLVVSGIATASAVAAPEYYINKVKLTGKESVSVTGGEYQFLSIVAGAEVKIKCIKTTGSGHIEAGGASTLDVTFEECKIEAPGGCKLSAAQEKKLSTRELNANRW
jgi:hypothetical protein